MPPKYAFDVDRDEAASYNAASRGPTAEGRVLGRPAGKPLVP